jgi:hypothetical protein
MWLWPPREGQSRGNDVPDRIGGPIMLTNRAGRHPPYGLASTWTTAFSTQPGRRGRCRQATTARRGPPLARTAASFPARRPNDPCSSWFDRTPIRSIGIQRLWESQILAQPQVLTRARDEAGTKHAAKATATMEHHRPEDSALDANEPHSSPTAIDLTESASRRSPVRSPGVLDKAGAQLPPTPTVGGGHEAGCAHLYICSGRRGNTDASVFRQCRWS